MPAAHTALVIGGGIAGPVAATALAMAGIDAAVHEARASDPTSADGIGGSLALEPNGLAALQIVGADDTVRAAAVPITRSVMSIASKPGREMPTPHGLPPRQLIDRSTASSGTGRSEPVCESTTPRSSFASMSTHMVSPPTSPTGPAPARTCSLAPTACTRRCAG